MSDGYASEYIIRPKQKYLLSIQNKVHAHFYCDILQGHHKEKMCLYIVPGAPTLFYQQGNQNSFIITSLASEFHHMGDEYASKYIIKRMQKSLLGIHNKGQMHF